jgi:hypothetical protein
MNCGPMTVTASKKKRYAPALKVKRQASDFPDMYVANIASHGCDTPDSVDLIFPHPGANVQTAGNGPFATPSCDLGKGGSGTAQQPTGVAPAAGSSAAPTAAPAAPTGFAGGNSGQYSQASGGNGGPVPTSSPTSSSSSDGLQVIPVTPGAGHTFTPVGPSATMTAPKYTNSTVPQVAGNTAAAAGPTGTGVSSPAPAPATGGSSTGLQTGPCSNEGEWNCIDGSSFQRCASGAWSVAIPMNGMKCTPGETADFSMTAAKAKRFTA